MATMFVVAAHKTARPVTLLQMSLLQALSLSDMQLTVIHDRAFSVLAPDFETPPKTVLWPDPLGLFLCSFPTIQVSYNPSYITFLWRYG